MRQCSFANTDYLNKYWLIVNCTLRNKLQWHFNQNMKIFNKKIDFKMSTAKWQPSQIILCQTGAQCGEVMVSLSGNVSTQRTSDVKFWWGYDITSNIWWHRSGSTLAQVIAWCHQAPSHHLNQCWLVMCGLVIFTQGQFHRKCFEISILDMSLKNY